MCRTRDAISRGEPMKPNMFSSHLQKERIMSDSRIVIISGFMGYLLLIRDHLAKLELSSTTRPQAPIPGGHQLRIFVFRFFFFENGSQTVVLNTDVCEQLQLICKILHRFKAVEITQSRRKSVSFPVATRRRPNSGYRAGYPSRYSVG